MTASQSIPRPTRVPESLFLASAGFGSFSSAQTPRREPLRLVQPIEMLGVKGRIDCLDADVPRNRLYGAGRENGSRKREIASRHTSGIELKGGTEGAFSRSSLRLNLDTQIPFSPNAKWLVGLGRELHNHGKPAATLVSYLGVQWSI